MALTVKRVERERRPGRYLDAHGLYLQVTKGGSKSWLYRWERTICHSDGSSKRREHCIGLGPTHTISLDEARELARQCRKQLLSGDDPLETRRSAKAEARLARAKRTTFAEAAHQWHAKQKPTYRSAKHAGEVLSTLERYAFPVFGEADVAAVDTGLIVKALAPHWSRMPADGLARCAGGSKPCSTGLPSRSSGLRAITRHGGRRTWSICCLAREAG